LPGIGSRLTAAQQAMREWLARTESERAAAGWTLGRWLRYWLTTHAKIRETTRFNYTRDVESFLIPHLGNICLAEVDYHRLKAGFGRIAARTGVGLHDLRHGAASLAHETGADLKTVQDLLGHASIVTTADMYTSVLPDAHHKAAQAAAQAVLQADRRTRQKIRNKARHNRPGPIPATGAPAPTRSAEPQKRRSKSSRRRGGHGQRGHPRDTTTAHIVYIGQTMVGQPTPRSRLCHR
jgi:hypothetical protein